MVDPLIELTNLLHTHNRADAPEIQAYIDEHKEEPGFLDAAQAILFGFRVSRPKGSAHMQSQPSPQSVPAVQTSTTRGD